ncbi:MAG TPA: hypothetical protein DD719_08250 [Desulfotomaculum sp.]|jgi:hypothetical protein|nr:hypothetical protein [Desulfotomaculum sp.]HCJ79273.1 hypothetical protein [Desulfotomaculum sp.]
MDKESKFITAVAGTFGNTHDSEATFALVDALARRAPVKGSNL